MPGGIRLLPKNDADVSTPPSGEVTFYISIDLGNVPAYKDDTGTVTSLQGVEGALSYFNHGNTGASEDIDVSAADIHRLVFNAATVAITFSNWPASGTPGVVRCYIVQDGTGGRLASWPGAVSWGAAGAPTLQTAAGAVDIIDFQSVDGGTTILGSYEVGSAAASAHIADTTDAHDASAISFDATGLTQTSATEVQTALEDLDAAIDGLGGGGGSHGSSIDYDLGGDVSVASANTYTDAASGTPAAGTYDIFWKVTCTANGSTATGFKCQLLAGATEIDYSEGYTFANERTTLSGFAFGVVLDGSTVVKTRMRANQTNTTISRDGGNGVNHDATKISLRKTH